MSDATKVEAKAKLDAIQRQDRLSGELARLQRRSPSSATTRSATWSARRSFERKRNLAKLGKPVDETEWGMTPPTVNAYYSPPQNNINFPAGILQPPFFDNNIDPAVNFGGIGVVIGHEMTHGFDDQGSKYDLNGNVRNWFTAGGPEASSTSAPSASPTSTHGFQVAEGQNLNGQLTLGENTADNGGIRIAFQALEETLAEAGRDGRAGLRRRQAGWLHPAAALLHQLRPGVVPESDASRTRACWRRPIRTAPASGASRARCRTSTSSARPSAARLASR